MLIKHGLKFLLVLFVSTVLVHAEPSVFGFGTEDTGTITVTDMVPTTSLRTMADMRRKILEQDERIEGLTTIIEGLSASLNEMNRGGASMSNNDASLQKLTGMIDEINAKYVSKDELQVALGKKSTVKSSTKSTNKTTKKDTISGKTKATLYSEGVRHFVKKRYTEAKQRFEITDKKGYKPAASNYYMGEIAYYTKKYEDAIFYFKKSAGLYDKASYIDTLLLHTAVSLEKTGDKGQAKAFYENIIENYKGKKTATIAKKRLKNL